MKDRVRVGMVGTSWYPDISHLPILKSHPQAQIMSICGRNRSRAEEMARKYDIANVFTDYQEMLRQGNLDAVIIAVPDDLHFPITMAALDAGLHVICEKPMAFNLEQAKVMLARAETAGVKHMVNFTWRWSLFFRYLKRLVDEGYIGKCYDAHFNFLGGYARQAGYQWKWDRQHGLGVLGDLGGHMIDLARLVVGDIARVQASLQVCVDKPEPQGRTYEGANDSAHLMVEFANGVVGTIFASAVTHIGNRGMVLEAHLHGERGTLEVYADGISYTVRGLRDGEDRFQTLPIPADILGNVDLRASTFEQNGQAFTTQSIGTRLFVDSILADKPITPSFEEGMRTQAVIEAAFESDRSGCWVDVP